MQAIITKYLGATNSNGARVRAKCQAKAITVPWDHSLGVEGNHDAAARELAAKLGWRYGNWHRGGMPDGTGNCYVLATAEPAFTLLKDGEA